MAAFFFPAAAQETDTTEGEREIPTINLSEEMLSNEMDPKRMSGLLQSQGDLFASITRYHFFSAGFYRRGYDSRNSVVYINGVNMNDVEMSQPIWGYWGGLNDVTRYSESRPGLTTSPFGFGTISGYTNMNMRASAVRQGTRVSYAITNRSYRHRLMATHSTGMMENGWAIAASGSRRYAQEGYVPGTFYDGWSYFLSAEKKINEEHSLGFIGFGSRTREGGDGLTRQEVYDLVGSNYYNPKWGWQMDEKRNSEVMTSHKPVIMLSHYWTPDDKTKLNTTLYTQFGRFGETRLDWYNARDPRPDYYRYLPSYYPNNESKRKELRQKWKNDPDTRQIDWEQMYFANRKNLYTVENVNGQQGNDVTGNRSKYIVGEERNDSWVAGLNSDFKTSITPKLDVTAGLQAMRYRSRNFKEVKDLLGGDFWVDVDQFAEQDFDKDSVAQNDLQHPNRLAREGDKYGYDYDIHIQRSELFGQAEYKLKMMDVYLGGDFTYTGFWRYGHMKNGRFPEQSFGKSKTHHYLNGGIKAGAEIRVTGRHIINVDGLYRTTTPQIRYAFLSPRINDKLVPGISSNKILSGEMSYHVKYPNFQSMVALYYTEINDQVWSRPFYHDVLRSFVNYSMSNVDQTFTGVELAAKYDLLPSLTLKAAATKNYFLWSSRPKATIIQNNSSEVIAENRTVYLRNYRIGGRPQTAATLGAEYNSPNYWFAGAHVNYFTDNFLPLNPDRRTQAAVSQYVVSDPQWGQMLDQKRLDEGFTVDMHGGKSWKIDEYYISIFASISNLLNKKDFRTWGFEQLRYDPNDLDQFPPMYDYMEGRTYYLMGTVRF